MEYEMDTNKLEILLSAVDPDKLEGLFDDRDISNLLCNGCEGGINYWATLVKHNRDEVGADYFHEAPLKDGGFFELRDAEDEEAEVARIDRNSINKGIKIFATKYPWHCANALTENDDSETADVFIQCIAFGEVIYG
jgi:hypothetical protein